MHVPHGVSLKRELGLKRERDRGEEVQGMRWGKVGEGEGDGKQNGEEEGQKYGERTGRRIEGGKRRHVKVPYRGRGEIHEKDKWIDRCILRRRPTCITNAFHN